MLWEAGDENDNGDAKGCGGENSDMHVDLIRCQKLRIFIFVLVIIIERVFSFGDAKEVNSHHLLRMKKCTVLWQKLNLNSTYSTFLKNTTNIEQKSKNHALPLNDSIHTKNANKIWQKFAAGLKTKDLKNNFSDPQSNNSVKLVVKNTTIVLPSTTCGNLMSFTKKTNRMLKKFQKICSIRRHETQIKTPEHSPVHCTEGKWQVGHNATHRTNIIKVMALFNETTKLNIINEEPQYINISLREGTELGEVFLWYASYANTTTPQFECMRVDRQNFPVNVTPNVNYLMCLAKIDKYFRVNIFDCQPFKTKPLRESQPWLTKKSIPTLIISIFVLLLSAMATGAFILYLSIHKNPSLIRGSKRVIEVKRQDKAQILIMPRSYESLPQADGPLAFSMTNNALEPAMSTLSCDTISSVSYVSANQPTPVEILTYRLNRLRELFERNDNIPPMVPSIPISFSTCLNQRLPPDVDLLLEYEWYTITTTVITTTSEED